MAKKTKAKGYVRANRRVAQKEMGKTDLWAFAEFDSNTALTCCHLPLCSELYKYRSKLFYFFFKIITLINFIIIHFMRIYLRSIAFYRWMEKNIDVFREKDVLFAFYRVSLPLSFPFILSYTLSLFFSISLFSLSLSPPPLSLSYPLSPHLFQTLNLSFERFLLMAWIEFRGHT